MLPSLSEHYKHSFKYAQLFSELEFNYAFAKTKEEKIEILDDFSSNYLMPHQLWNVRLKSFKALNTDFEDALVHFCNDVRMQNYDYNSYMYSFILQRDDNEEEDYFLDSNSVKKSPFLEKYTKFPHEFLRYYFMKYEQKISSPLSSDVTNNVDKFEVLYWKIIKANNVENWFEKLEETNIFDFLKQNVEHRLCFNLWDKTLWKLYINYLKTFHPYEMLIVYSKYCRYFLDDLEMLKKYEEEVVLHGPIYVTWHNPFNFETIGFFKPNQSPNYTDEVEYENMADNYEILDDSFKWFHQRWSIPSPMIRHIYITANHKILSKLHRSCKYFFKRKPQFICYKFVANLSENLGNNLIKMEGQSATYSFKKCHWLALKKWNITTIFNFFHSDSHILSNFMKTSLCQCNARYITISNQIISAKEFMFLVGHKNVEKLKLFQTLIVKENDEYFSLEEILKLLPQIRSFISDTIALTTKKVLNLAQLNFINKFITFCISFVTNDIVNINDICTFIKKNAAPFSFFEILCDEDFPQDILEIYQVEIENYLKQWKVNDGKPIVCFHNDW